MVNKAHNDYGVAVGSGRKCGADAGTGIALFYRGEVQEVEARGTGSNWMSAGQRGEGEGTGFGGISGRGSGDGRPDTYGKCTLFGRGVG